MDIEMLKEVVPMLHQQLEKCQADRNWTQLERDTVQTFYDVTRREVRDLFMGIAAKERAMELMEDNHRVEVRVYVQKVKHLEYEHKNSLKSIAVDTAGGRAEEAGMHGDRVDSGKGEKEGLKAEIGERELVNGGEIGNVKVRKRRREERREEKRSRCAGSV